MQVPIGNKENVEKAFTLVELITVIAIIVLLIGLLFPAFRGAMTKAKEADTQALITRIDAAAYRYESEWRDYPPSPNGGGTPEDNAALYTWLTYSGGSGPFEEFSDKETVVEGADPNEITYIVDAWKHKILYWHFTDYDDSWPEWRLGKKKYEFQIISPTSLWGELDTDASDFVEPSELNGINGKQVKKIITNW